MNQDKLVALGQGLPQGRSLYLLLPQKHIGIAVRLTFETLEGQKTSSELTVVNNGTVAISYDWRRQSQLDSFQDLKRNRMERFYFNNREGTWEKWHCSQVSSSMSEKPCLANGQFLFPASFPIPSFFHGMCHLLTIHVCWGKGRILKNTREQRDSRGSVTYRHRPEARTTNCPCLPGTFLVLGP